MESSVILLQKTLLETVKYRNENVYTDNGTKICSNGTQEDKNAWPYN